MRFVLRQTCCKEKVVIRLQQFYQQSAGIVSFEGSETGYIPLFEAEQKIRFHGYIEIIQLFLDHTSGRRINEFIIIDKQVNDTHDGANDNESHLHENQHATLILLSAIDYKEHGSYE